MTLHIVQLIYYGIVFGSVLALGAIGISLIFGILRFANFAHGDMMTAGAYLAFLFFTQLQWPFWLAVILALIGAAIYSVLLDWAFYRRLRRTAPVILLISSLGTGLILRSLVQLIWGPDNQVYRTGIEIPYRFHGLVFTTDSLQVIAGAVVCVVAVHIFLGYTRMGKAMRAMSDNMDLALVSGIPAERVIFWTWVAGGILAAAGGILLGMNTELHPTMGFRILLPMFAAAILGGIGRPYGAIAGAFVIGLAMELSSLFISPAYKPAVAFAIMVLVLIWRPEGIFKGQSL